MQCGPNRSRQPVGSREGGVQIDDASVVHIFGSRWKRILPPSSITKHYSTFNDEYDDEDDDYDDAGGGGDDGRA